MKSGKFIGARSVYGSSPARESAGHTRHLLSRHALLAAPADSPSSWRDVGARVAAAARKLNFNSGVRDSVTRQRGGAQVRRDEPRRDVTSNRWRWTWWRKQRGDVEESARARQTPPRASCNVPRSASETPCPVPLRSPASSPDVLRSFCHVRTESPKFRAARCVCERGEHHAMRNVIATYQKQASARSPNCYTTLPTHRKRETQRCARIRRPQ